MIARSFPAASETFVRDQVLSLRNAGIEVDLFALRPSTPAPGSDGAGNARYLIGPTLPPGRTRLRALGRLLRTLRAPRALLRLLPHVLRSPDLAIQAVHAIPVLRRARASHDVIHAHFGPTGALALLLRDAGLLRGALVTTFHGVDLTTVSPEEAMVVYSDLFRRGERFTVNSGFAEDLAVRLGAPAARLRRLPVGVDLERLPFSPRARAAGEPTRLLTVGRLEPVKGIAFGLRAVARLVAGGLDVRYTVVGGGTLEADLRREAASLGIADRVRFTGPLSSEDVFRAYRDHHVFLLPGVVTTDGQTEAQGRVLVEAQAAGLPVVATRVGGIPESVAAGAGVLVPPSDAESLAAALREMVEHPERWATMGEQGRKHVERRYDSDQLLRQLLDVYDDAMAASLEPGGAR